MERPCWNLKYVDGKAFVAWLIAEGLAEYGQLHGSKTGLYFSTHLSETHRRRLCDARKGSRMHYKTVDEILCRFERNLWELPDEAWREKHPNAERAAA